MIPAVAHFIWFGDAIPWTHALAARSALRHGELDRVVFHHDAAPELVGPGPMGQVQGVESRRIDLEALLRPLGERAEPLLRLLGRLQSPSARANLLRAALLATEGGIYLDTDTVTVRSLAPLRKAGFFCGREPVVYPGKAGSPHGSARWLARARSSARSALAAVPGGWRGFRWIEGAYPWAENNAVLGSTPGHPFALRLLDAMIETPPERQTVRFALGTHLLQAEVARWRPSEPRELVVHRPEVFYPLGPRISRHWFRIGGRPSLDAMLRPTTRVVHWYASVENQALVSGIDEAYVERHADRQAFSALARRYG